MGGKIQPSVQRDPKPLDTFLWLKVHRTQHDLREYGWESTAGEEQPLALFLVKSCSGSGAPVKLTVGQILEPAADCF